MTLSHQALADLFDAVDPLQVPGALMVFLGPFTWGATPESAVEHSVILVEVARMAHPDAHDLRGRQEHAFGAARQARSPEARTECALLPEQESLDPRRAAELGRTGPAPQCAVSPLGAPNTQSLASLMMRDRISTCMFSLAR